MTSELTLPQPLPWYVSSAATLVASGITALVAVLTVTWSRVQQIADRGTDRADRRTREARLRGEAELRERRAADRTAWTTYYRRIDELLVDTSPVSYEAQRRRLHDDDLEAAELLRLIKLAEQYAEFAPGGLPAALDALARAVTEVHRHLLPAKAELRRTGAADPDGSGYRPLFTKAGDQTRAADGLAAALTAARNALHDEWGTDG